VALVQFLFVLRLAGAQLDGARVIDQSGAQRMRSQILAYNAAMAHFGEPDPNWRANVERSIGEMTAVRALLRQSPAYLRGPFDAAGRSQADRDLAKYITAVRAIERDPTAREPFAIVREMRPLMLREFDTAVQYRRSALDARARMFTFAVIAGMVGELITIVVVYFSLVAPWERANDALLEQVSHERARMMSFFDENPDSIAVYDTGGRLLHANPARLKMLNSRIEDQIGRHISTFPTQNSLDAALFAFERANQGETAAASARLRGSDSYIDVESTFFPYVVDGRREGVIAVSKDVRALVAARAESDMQTKRMNALYDIAAAHGRSWERQLTDAVALAAAHLRTESGVVSEILDDTVIVLAIVGNPGLRVGDTFPLAETLSRAIIAHDGVWEVGDLQTTEWRPVPPANQWRNIIATRISVDGETCGTFALVGNKPREAALSNIDRDFVKILSALLGSIIERGRHEKRLDELARLDALTGLPNRKSVHDRIDELIVAARREQRAFAVHFVDLDKFKAVNDTGGHAVGDEVLRLTASRLQHCVREHDVVARLGGDEFVILQPFEDGINASDLAERIVDAIEKPFAINGRNYELSCSVGVSYFPGDGADGLTLLSRADNAMYRAKSSSRVRVEGASNRERIAEGVVVRGRFGSPD
jgi:diguanylate cyclase (GGDEF)-like protein/PAS domain S-box-containing protein